MIKNFYEYVKELIPEKGSVFFTEENHCVHNSISLYQLADLLCGQKIEYAEEVTAYSWNVPEYWEYPFKTVGLMFYFEQEGCERWIHFSKNAFISAICVVATRNNIAFDNVEHEKVRQIWERKLENKETKEDKDYTDLENLESNFDSRWWVLKSNVKQLERESQQRKVKDFFYEYTDNT